MEVQHFLKQELIHVNLGVSMTQEKIEQLKAEYDYVLIAVGTHQPKTIPFPGHERVIPALDYLKAAKSEHPMATGKQVVIIGAGNVGCDVAAECYRLGASQVTLVDIQKPLAFGKEREAAEALGAAKRTAEYLIAQMEGKAWKPFAKKLIQYEALTIAHYDPAEDKGKTEEQQAARCLSCGSCRDCHLCETMCPTHAISREELPAEEAADGVAYRYISDDSKCIASPAASALTPAPAASGP